VRDALDAALSRTDAAGRLPMADVRARVVLAGIDEVVDRPELLGAYATTFADDDDVTLVLDAFGWSDERVASELVPLAQRHGLGDGGPDAVVLTDGRPWPRERLVGRLAAIEELR
jgi:hypothetical protein